MNLTPREKDKLLVAMAATVARRRLERGVKLNHPEAIALIADTVVGGRTRWAYCRTAHAIRRTGPHPGSSHGGRAGDDPRHPGRSHVSRRHQARPLSISPSGECHDSRRSHHRRRRSHSQRGPPGAYPVHRQQWGSPHSGGQPLSFCRSKSGVAFDRAQARGMRLDIPSGTAMRFEPGQQRAVQLVAYAGARIVIGFRGEVMGPLASGRGIDVTCHTRSVAAPMQPCMAPRPGTVFASPTPNSSSPSSRTARSTARK